MTRTQRRRRLVTIRTVVDRVLATVPDQDYDLAVRELRTLLPGLSPRRLRTEVGMAAKRAVAYRKHPGVHHRILAAVLD